jgi:speckle-type POZ protein
MVMPQIQSTESVEPTGSKSHFKKLFMSAKLADIVIMTKDGEFGVHKNIISRSDVFECMLYGTTNEAQSGVIRIEDINHDVLVEMCRFLYYDEIPKIQTLALELLVAADKYMVSDLAVKCCQYLMVNITTENFLNILTTAYQLNKEALREAAIDFIIA